MNLASEIPALRIRRQVVYKLIIELNLLQND